MITLVSFLETASSAKVDNAQRGQRWDQDQDLIGQGLAKLSSALVGAFPTSSSFSRSALNLYAGARTGWATLFSVVVVLVAVLLLTPLLAHVPLAVLAAIVVGALTLTLAYSIRVIVVAFFGEPREAHHEVKDVTFFLALPRAMLVTVLLVLGFYPKLILDVIDPATRALVAILRP